MSDADNDHVSRIFGNYPKPQPAINEYGLVTKPYPCCGYTHRLIDCAKVIRQRPGFQFSRIRHIVGSLPLAHGEVIRFRHPENTKQALFSLLDVVSLTLMGRNVSLGEL